MPTNPNIIMGLQETPYESPFETQSNALALKQAQMATQAAGEDRMLTMLRKGREVLASSYDEPSYQRGLQTLQRLGIPTDDMPKAFDPSYVEQEGRALLNYEQRHKQQLFQDGGDIFGVNPYTGNVNMLRQGPQAPPPAPKPVEPRLSEIVDPKNSMRSLRVDLNMYKGGTLGDPGVYGVSSIIREPKPAAAAKTPTSRAAPATPNVTDSAAAQAFLDVLVVDPTTKEDDISAYIKKSTGGLLQKGSAAVAEAFDVTTEGQEAIGVLKSRASELVQGLLGGKLGAGISNADREFMMQRIGDIGNDSVSTGKRLAAWKSVVDLMKRRAAGNQTPVGGAGGADGVDTNNPLLK